MAGLAVSMAVGLLMIVFISELSSYDHFHTKKDRIFRVISKDDNQVELASTSVKAGREIRQGTPGVDEVTILRRRGNWYHIDAQDIGLGWVFAKYLDADC